MGGNATPQPHFPRERPQYPPYRGWVGSRVCLDRCGKSPPLPGFDPRTVQPVASRILEPDNLFILLCFLTSVTYAIQHSVTGWQQANEWESMWKETEGTVGQDSLWTGVSCTAADQSSSSFSSTTLCKFWLAQLFLSTVSSPASFVSNYPLPSSWSHSSHRPPILLLAFPSVLLHTVSICIWSWPLFHWSFFLHAPTSSVVCILCILL